VPSSEEEERIEQERFEKGSREADFQKRLDRELIEPL
jgi:hypothetical protein